MTTLNVKAVVLDGFKDKGRYLDKPIIATWLALVSGKDGIETAAKAVIYGSPRGERVYCTFFLYGKTFYASGQEWAGGGGYHKASSALEGAMHSAGITFVEGGSQWYFGGAGDAPMKRAMEAAARLVTKRRVTVMEVRG